MAIIYLRSTDGSDSNDGSTWALAKATLAAALTAAGAGGTVYVSRDHAETQATAMNLDSPGTAASPVRVLCVNDAAEPPTALATTATVSTTGNAAMNFTAGYVYCYGVTFNCGSGFNNARMNFGALTTSSWWWRIERGKLALVATGNDMPIIVGTSVGAGVGTGQLELVDTVVSFAHAAQHIRVHRNFSWRGPSDAAGTVGTAPTALIVIPGRGVSGPTVKVSGVDLSAASGALVDVAGAAGARVSFENCKLHASATVTTGTPFGPNGTIVELVNCDSADTNYNYHRHSYQGDITDETTIVRTDGASNGDVPFSLKMVSSANAKFFSPLESPPVTVWNETTGSAITVSIPVVTDGVTLTDAEAWIEVEYLGTSGFPLSTIASDRAADILATPANQTTDATSTWTTTGLSSPLKQTLSVSITPQEKGLIRARVMLARASTTMYVDPMAQVA